MTDTQSLVERLRDCARYDRPLDPRKLCDEAADLIDRLQAEMAVRQEFIDKQSGWVEKFRAELSTAQARAERAEAAILAAERRGLERAAEVAEAHYDAGYGHSSLPAAIRALAGEEET